MRRDHIDFQDRSTPLAFLISFRCYGTWLHGDDRGSVGRSGSNRYGEPGIRPNDTLVEIDGRAVASPPFLLGAQEREIVRRAIKEVCEARHYHLYALHVRTNHAHVVVNNAAKVERMMDSFKAYATRALRAAELIDSSYRPWSRHGSTRYLWTKEHIDAAAEYVINGQGEELPRFE